MMAFLALAMIASCSQVNKSESEKQAHDEVATAHDEEGEAHEHATEMHEGHNDSATSDGDAKIWRPGATDENILQSDFHFLAGSVNDVSPEVVNEGESKVLKLTPNGKQAGFVFHAAYGSVGVVVSTNISQFEGSFRLIHHAQDKDKFEFVELTSEKMRLGRTVNGAEKIFDEKAYSPGTGWLDLRVSAAGSHYKGYIGDKTITHGHGDVMEDGFVGIMLKGSGTVLIKSIEVSPLSNE